MPQLSVARRLRRGGRVRFASRSKASARRSPRSSASPRAGPANQPTLVTNWTQFTQTFGEFIEGSYLAHAVYGYFLNGGGAAYVVRVGADGAMPTASGRAAERRATRRKPAYRVAALEAGPAGNDISVDVQPSSETTEDTFKLVVNQGGKAVEIVRQRHRRQGQAKRRRRW